MDGWVGTKGTQMGGKRRLSEKYFWDREWGRSIKYKRILGWAAGFTMFYFRLNDIHFVVTLNFRKCAKKLGKLGKDPDNILRTQKYMYN